ncbi:MAG: sortase [Candidatus Peribacteraceae bacterium]|nr:sortase [Candidatus Peribacteraceae bacterium]
MLTQKQKAFAAYSLAVINLFLALVLWTRVLAVPFPPEAVPADGFPVMIPPPAILADHGASEAPVRPAAPPPVVVAQGQPETAEPAVPFLSPAAQTDERAQWGVTRRYELVIPSLSVRVPVYVPERTYWDARSWELLEQQMQVGLLYGAVAYPHSVAPGAAGALIIAGHSSPPTARAEESVYGSIFARLPDIEEGSEVLVRYGTTTARYIVETATVVSASDTSILAVDDAGAVLKLITCYPVGSVKDRLVVQARAVRD